MANYVSKADGNLTTAGTWYNVETGTRGVAITKTNTTATTTSTVYNADAQDITGTNAKNCVGLLMYCKQLSSTGTVKVVLSADSGTTETKSLTINATDLPTNYSWVFFKWASVLALDGGTDYAIGIQGSSATNADFYYDTSLTNWCHVLVWDDSPGAAPTTGDNLYIAGVQTGAGAETTCTVTMDDTASVDYGTIDIGNIGTLSYGTTASTNYTLKMSGNLNVWGDGTLSIGTTGTPIPRNSTAILNFDCTSAIEFGLIINNGGTFNSQGLSRTSGNNTYYCKLNSDAAINDTHIHIDTSTGWLDNDVIAIATTTRTYTQCESGTLNGNDSGSPINIDGFGGVGGGLAYAHSGTSPTQAEVILLTRNVKIYGASATNVSYITVAATATVDADWTEFYWMGNGTIRGIVINTTSGSINFQYCSRHTSTVSNCMGWQISSSSGSVINISNNVSYNIAGRAIYISSASTGVTTIDSNIFMKSTDGNSALIDSSDLGATITNNITVGSSQTGIYFYEPTASIGTFSGNTSHGNNSVGVSLNYIGSGTIDSLTCWFNNSNGLTTDGVNIKINSCVFFGNSSYHINFGGSNGNVEIHSSTFNSHSTYGTNIGIYLGGSSPYNFGMKIYNCSFGSTTAHSASDISSVNTPYNANIIFYNTIFSSSTEVNNYNSNSPNGYISSQKHDQTKGLHKTWKKYGTLTIDTTAGMYNSASPSERLTPNNASGKLESGIKRIAVNDGATLTPSVYVRESVAGDGTDYNGNRIRLIVKRNDALGITEDTVLATATASSEGAFQVISGTTAAATDNGVMEFVVDCDGTTGWINVDDWSVS